MGTGVKNITATDITVEGESDVGGIVAIQNIWQILVIMSLKIVQ